MSDDEGYQCEECGERRATVHETRIHDGRAVAHHYCDECYERKAGRATMAPADLFNRLLEAIAPELKELETQNCPACGINYLEFRQTMELGCPNDYRAFREPLEQILERIHGATQHCGKVPPGVDRDTAVRAQLRSLRQRQQEAVEVEDYELAAELRDRIEELEADGPGEPE